MEKVELVRYLGFRDLIIKIGNLFLKPAYWVYERWLWFQIKNGPFPSHVAIIPDGNRRWARRLGLEPHVGHEYGYEKLKEVIDWLFDLNINAVTVYAMSNENCLYRPELERQHLFKIIAKGLDELISKANELCKKGVKVKVIGRLDIIPDFLKIRIKKIEELTSKNNSRILTIALCYGGRQEILDAVKKLVKDVVNGELSIENINEDIFTKYLYTEFLGSLQEPDLIIRTSGEIRISNFLLWQSAYSELYFCEAFWPEFRKIDLWRAIRSYQRRERRFGR